MKYIFIDTNQYRHLFSKNEGFSDQIKALLDKLIDKNSVTLLLPKQVRDEVERNRFEDWYKQESESCEGKIKSFKLNIERREKELLTNFKKEFESIKVKLLSDISNEEKELKNIKKRYRNLKSKANQKLKSIFDKAKFIEETDEIIYLARLRYEKGNPPNDNKLGDALIWESIIGHFSGIKGKSSLIFIARDGDAWGYDGFNPWLAKELKEKTNIDITLAGKLSDIEELTKDEQDSLRKIERKELKDNALANFLSSRSFVSAGSNITELEKYKDLLEDEDYFQIINSSISNSQIYQSFFTSSGLNSICQGDDGYVVDCLEATDSFKWKRFVRLNNILLKRQTDEKNGEIIIADLPF